MSSFPATTTLTRYRSVDARKAQGEHYTPPALADFVARKIVDLGQGIIPTTVRILDPAVGGGALLSALIRRLLRAGCTEIEVHGFDTVPEALVLARQHLLEQFPLLDLTLHEGSFLEYAMTHLDVGQRELFDRKKSEHFDVVVANPPYVRTQVLGSVMSRELSRRFGLKGRVDLSHAFVRAIAGVLHPYGLLGLIISNRFMTTKSGATVRQEIQRQFDIRHVWDLGDTKLFDAAVLPAVLMLQKRGSYSRISEKRFTSIYSCTPEEPVSPVAHVLDGLERDGAICAEGTHYQVLQGTLIPTHPGGVWRVAREECESWLQRVSNRTWSTFSELGKIRVGVKTTADSVFIREDWEEVCRDGIPELLRPVLTHHVAERYRAQHDPKRRILYPHRMEGKKRHPVDLSRYPNTERYLSLHRERLSSREYLRESGRAWYELWVPHDPTVWNRTKLVWRDIVEHPTFWIDEHEAVVNGDCYWMVCDTAADERLLWLAVAVGNSSFVEVFYDKMFNNRLYARRRRFITQYVEKFPLPDPTTTIAAEIIDTARRVYLMKQHSDTSAQENAIDHLVWNAFGMEKPRTPTLRAAELETPPPS